VAGGAGFTSWFQAIGGTLLGVGAAIGSFASGAKGIADIATE